MINANFCLLFEAHGDLADRNDEDEDEIPDKTFKADSVDEWLQKLSQSQILDEDDYCNIDNRADRNDEDEDEIPDKTSKAHSVDEWFQKLSQSQFLVVDDADYVKDDDCNIDN
ncbi:hypothetical protein J6590_095733 [Homalodisca vitripennis]|nr:hypothetical protein J6590_095733 [Homalodisca vitripennis]